MYNFAMAKTIFLVLGIFNILLGLAMEKFKLYNFITFYNPKIEDGEKLSDLMGQSFIFMGIFNLLIVLIAHIGGLEQTKFIIAQVMVIVGFQIFIILKRRQIRSN